MTTPPDPLAAVPDPDTLRRMIRAQVDSTQTLRQLLRLSLRLSKAPALAAALPVALDRRKGATDAGR